MLLEGEIMNLNPTPDGSGNQPSRRDVAYLPLSPTRGARVPELPTPAAYRQTTPAVLGPPPSDEKSRLFTRRRVVIGFGVAVLLHALLIVGWWLSPPLRLKAGYAPERWVPVLSLPKPASPAPAPPPPPAGAQSSSAPPRNNATRTSAGKKAVKSRPRTAPPASSAG